MSVFFFNDTATTEIYTLSLHDALPISGTLRIDADIDLVGRLIPEGSFTVTGVIGSFRGTPQLLPRFIADLPDAGEFQEGAEVSSDSRSEEHTSELQSPDHLVCRLLLEKKKEKKVNLYIK